MNLVEYTVGELALDIRTGKTPPTTNQLYFKDEVDWLTPSDLKGQKTITHSERKISKFALEDKKAFLYKPNTVIISTIGDIGKSCVVEKQVASNQQLTGVYVNTNIILADLFYYWILRSKKILENKANRAVIPILSNKLLKKIKIIFPEELKEQSKIVTQLNKIQDLINKRVEATQSLEKYICSIFLEMFLENPESKAWDFTEINEAKIIKETIYGTAKKANEEKMGVPVLRMNNITYTGEIDLNDIKWVKLSDIEYKRLKLKNRDILFNRTNSPDLVGKTGVWDKGEGYTFAGYLVKIELDEEKMSPYYFSSFFNSMFGKKVLQNKARPSGSLANISATTLKKQKILIAPIESQRKYEEAFLKVQIQKQKFQQSLQFLESLFQATLQNAFTEGNQIDEEKLFEDILKDLTIEDIKKGERLHYLINWLNKDKDTERFSNIDNYSVAIERVLELLEDGSIEQFIVDNHVKLKVAL